MRFVPNLVCARYLGLIWAGYALVGLDLDRFGSIWIETKVGGAHHTCQGASVVGVGSSLAVEAMVVVMLC